MSAQQHYPLRNQQLPPQQHLEIPSLIQTMPPIKRKRGRPPLDGEFDSYSTPKITHVEGGAHSNVFGRPQATSMVEAVLDEEHSQPSVDPQPDTVAEVVSQQPDQGDDGDPHASPGHVRIVDLPALLGAASHTNDQHHHQGHEEDGTANGDDWPEYGIEMECEEDSLAGRLIPKLERPDTPGEQEAKKIMYQHSMAHSTESKQMLLLQPISPPATPANGSVRFSL